MEDKFFCGDLLEIDASSSLSTFALIDSEWSLSSTPFKFTSVEVSFRFVDLSTSAGFPGLGTSLGFTGFNTELSRIESTTFSDLRCSEEVLDASSFPAWDVLSLASASCRRFKRGSIKISSCGRNAARDARCFS